ncbi:MAG: hypothetical protein QOE58_3305, partial [Actinomycetota bacterium]|nr:hypothetical protein [Actinomycetota bacterium]
MSEVARPSKETSMSPTIRSLVIP